MQVLCHSLLLLQPHVFHRSAVGRMAAQRVSRCLAMLVPMRNLMMGLVLLASGALGQAAKPLRLYIMDCGTIGAMDMALYNLKPEEIRGPATLVNVCYLIVHSRGTLLWDVGQIADEAFPADGKPAGGNGTFR